MSLVLTIAGEEWRLWKRSRLAATAMGLFAALLIATSLFTGLRMSDAQHTREHQQHAAEETFLSQPDRHPHRMVHYGHYAFRTPPPLSIIDPGVDAVTGQSILRVASWWIVSPATPFFWVRIRRVAAVAVKNVDGGAV